eukprot:TRINITY_DN13898_c2_g1_i1.p1 TRINITY_DN13898_c2_g1~~TRINITY_DN13898_c2_g1_i1.p1  ORF type:complete len:326 (+),score=66.06 TRINITY_DN13898_c2_g1_i1:60-1037(+)
MPAVAFSVFACTAGAASLGIAARKQLPCSSQLMERCKELFGQQPQQAPRRDPKELLDEVRKRSMAVMYTVSDKTNTQFSLRGLTKYLKMKGVEVFEGSTDEETIAVNAERLLQLLDEAADSGKSTAKGSRLRHELVKGGYSPEDLQARFSAMKEAYMQQPLDYGRNSRYGDKWRISCYLVVMENWKPKIEAHEPMVQCMGDVMNSCCKSFEKWHCEKKGLKSVDVSVMNAFVTRYRPTAEEDQLKRHIDGANVDGSVILALPTDDPFEGGELIVWDGPRPQKEYTYQMKPGDCIFLDNAVWHQAKPITSGERWALVLFLRLRNPT